MTDAITIGSLFSGYGGLDLAVERITRGRTVWVSDIDPGACKVLAHRWPAAPNVGDITRVDWSALGAPVDVLTGGFPCQDVSQAGRRAGMKPGSRTGLWSTMVRVIEQHRPALVVAENVEGLLSGDGHADVGPCPWCVDHIDPDHRVRALGAVLGDLADVGYDAAWHSLTAASVGAPHGRMRVFIIAWPTDSIPRRVGFDGWGFGPEGKASSWAPREADRLGKGYDVTADPDGARLPGQQLSSGEVAQVTAVDGGVSAFPDEAYGEYVAAVRRWERVTRPAPMPVVMNKNGRPQLNAEFDEWMMGLPAGHITGVPGVGRRETLKLCGNGVVPQQAEAAIRHLLSAVAE